MKTVKTNQNFSHNHCGGKLKLMTDKPVRAGKNGEGFLLFQCEKCQRIMIVGGK